MNEKDLNKFFDKILSVREDIQGLIKGYNESSIKKVRDRFIYLAFQQQKTMDIEDNKKRLVELIFESIETVQRTIDYSEDMRPPDKKLEEKEIWLELKNVEVELRKKAEKNAWPELDKIIDYIKANRQKLIWGFMLNHPESGLWILLGDVGIKIFERIFMMNVRMGGQSFIFPDKKALLTEGRQNIARYIKEKIPDISLEKISEVINNQYAGEFINERKIKYWLYQKEIQGIEELPLSPEKDSKYMLRLEFNDNPEINTKIFNAIQRRLFDEEFQELLEEKAKEDRRYKRDRR